MDRQSAARASRGAASRSRALRAATRGTRADSIPCRRRLRPSSAHIRLMTSTFPRLSPRLWLWVALAALLLLNYQTWMHDYGAPPGAVAGSPATNAAQRAAAPASDLGSRIPEAPRTATAAAAQGAPA